MRRKFVGPPTATQMAIWIIRQERYGARNSYWWWQLRKTLDSEDIEGGRLGPCADSIMTLGKPNSNGWNWICLKGKKGSIYMVCVDHFHVSDRPNPKQGKMVSCVDMDTLEVAQHPAMQCPYAVYEDWGKRKCRWGGDSEWTTFGKAIGKLQDFLAKEGKV